MFLPTGLMLRKKMRPSQIPKHRQPRRPINQKFNLPPTLSPLEAFKPAVLVDASFDQDVKSQPNVLTVTPIVKPTETKSQPNVNPVLKPLAPSSTTDSKTETKLNDNQNAKSNPNIVLNQLATDAKTETKSTPETAKDDVKIDGVRLTDFQLSILTAAFEILKVDASTEHRVRLAELAEEKRLHLESYGYVVTDAQGVRTSVAVLGDLPGEDGSGSHPTWKFPCPRCESSITMRNAELACKIFRHGQVPPHASLAECEKVLTTSKTGCGAALEFKDGIIHIVGHNT